ncbi:two-component sensor EnvZ [Pseudomonas aeruginosa]|nr:two-component sensor EnvZ [Pseudomonas aeruginosa]
MKTPLWFPQSFFARTLWLVLIVVLFSKALTLVYLLMNEDVIVDRQYSHGAALTIRAFWAADEESRAAIAKASGLRWVPSSADQPGEQHWPYTEIFQRQMQMELGPDTETRLRIHQPVAALGCARRASAKAGWRCRCIRIPCVANGSGACSAGSSASACSPPPPPGSSSASSASRSSAWWSPPASSARGAACVCRWAGDAE